MRIAHGMGLAGGLGFERRVRVPRALLILRRLFSNLGKKRTCCIKRLQALSQLPETPSDESAARAPWSPRGPRRSTPRRAFTPSPSASPQRITPAPLLVEKAGVDPSLTHAASTA